ncbi:MAG: aldo/keto reductase [candidate division Zixibacteria bacterium]|nr:aldo/keto reductase [candidate division Zixibacteria bacterium]
MIMKELTINSKIKLNNGVELPIFGLGTFQTRSGKETREAVLYALQVGYRLIDTASIYGNEEDVGEAVRKSGIPREEIFITTKLWNTDHGYDKALTAFERSLERLGLSYVDLYLIHWPEGGLRNESWKALERIIKEGKCRAIGVSNYTIRHLKELLKNSPTVPAVNQVEFHPYLYQKELLEFCHSHKIQLEAYSPLTKGRKLNDPKLLKIALNYSKTTAQILIRWVLQKGVVVIPKSSRKERIEENARVFDFEISDEDMKALDSFNQDYRTSWDPTDVP